MATASPERYFGQFPTPTLPTLPQPPESEVLDAMRYVPTALCDMWFGRSAYSDRCDLMALQFDLMSAHGRPQRREHDQEHSEAATQWAIHRHVIAGRLAESADGSQAFVTPTDALWTWWRDEPHGGDDNCSDDDCGRWLYEQWQAGKTYREIETEFQAVRAVNGWRKVSSTNGIKSRIVCYARSHNNLPLRKGKGGRPKQPK